MAEVQSNRAEHDKRFDKAVKKALRLVGGQAERAAKELIADMGAVDTGFLRNSITFAIAGNPPSTSEYKDDKGNKEGVYAGVAPSEDGDNEYSVYIGTNVYYAPYVEYGTRKMEARPFLSQSIQSNHHNFERLFREAFEHFSGS